MSKEVLHFNATKRWPDLVQENIAGINERRETARERGRERTKETETATRRLTFKTVLRNLSDLVYFRRYRCHARSVTVALNQQARTFSWPSFQEGDLRDTRERQWLAIIVMDAFALARPIRVPNSNTIESIFLKRPHLHSVFLYFSEKIIIFFLWYFTFFSYISIIFKK